MAGRVATIKRKREVEVRGMAIGFALFLDSARTGDETSIYSVSCVRVIDVRVSRRLRASQHEEKRLRYVVCVQQLFVLPVCRANNEINNERRDQRNDIDKPAAELEFVETESNSTPLSRSRQSAVSTRSSKVPVGR